MSFYEAQPWAAQQVPQQPTTQQYSWTQTPHSSRSGTAPPPATTEPHAFSSQLEEIDRAMDNMYKSSQYMGGMPGGPMHHDMSHMQSRPYDTYASHRQHGYSEFDNMRGPPAGNPNGIHSRRHPADADQAMHAGRRMAAQREGDLRNYHQAQQFSRATSIPSDRPSSTDSLLEGQRRDLSSRQHRALYGDNSSLSSSDLSGVKSVQQMSTTNMQSPRALDQFPPQPKHLPESIVQMPIRTDIASMTARRRESASVTKSNPSTFGTIDAKMQTGSRTAAASPHASPALGAGLTPLMTSSIGAIGSRLGQAQSAISKYPSTTVKERSSSVVSTPATAQDKTSSLGAWGNNSVWGTSKVGLGVQASVWG